MAKYTEWVSEEGLLKIEGWARDGLTDKQIAANVGVSYSTFRDWAKRFSALSAALKKGKEVVDRQVENALLKRALGYEYEELTRELVFNKETGEYELRVTKKVTKQVAPDTTAQIFWLKNRKPKEWRDVKSIEAEVQHNNPLEGLTTEEIKKALKLDG